MGTSSSPRGSDMRAGNPHVLVAIGGNAREWSETLRPVPNRPRLPLPYAFGAGLIKRDFALSCVDSAHLGPRSTGTYPFRNVYSRHDLVAGMQATDLAAFWGALGIRSVLAQAGLESPRRRVVLCTYVWTAPREAHWRTRRLCAATRVAARFARAVVVMTREQEMRAAALLGERVPVVRLVCGVDTAYYGAAVSSGDVPEEHRKRVDQLLKAQYLIMPGDELRLNSDALDIVETLGIPLVRVSQYRDKSRSDLLRNEIAARGLADRVLVLERIDYSFLRFLLRNAAAYAGFVDSTWQPAGWTVACEALASGLPVVAYDGLVTRELNQLGADPAWLRAVPRGDLRPFAEEIQRLVSRSRDGPTRDRPDAFASRVLNLESTGDRFACALARASD